MRRRSMFTFLLVNIIVSLVVAFGAISFLSERGGEPNERLVTFEVIITATRDPLVTPNVIVITATPDPELPERAVIPDDVREGTVVAGITAPAPTIDPEVLSGNAQAADSTLPEGCILHVIAEGDFPSALAVEYEISVFEILAVNNLTEEDATNLQIGQELIIPLAGCPVDQFIVEQPTATPTITPSPDVTEESEQTAETTEEAEPSATETATVTPSITPTPTETPIPTVTLAPTASDAQVEIVEIIGRGDITTEGVVIRNNGNTVDISGWTLSDADGNVYVFPDGRRLFSGASITVYTRSGENTAILFYWGRDTAVFGESGAGGEVIVIANREGQAQASLRLPQ